MRTQGLEYYERRRGLDPEDEKAQLDVILAKSRVEGPGAFLEALSCRKTWNETVESLQDLCIAEVERRLGAHYERLGTAVYECQGLSHRLASFRHLQTGIDLQLIPGGRFLMGSEATGELPVREVQVPPFLLGRFLVTQEQWSKIQENPSFYDYPNHPVEQISWRDAQSWLELLSGGLRLPTEAEWEYACRAGSTTKYFWGNHFNEEYVWYERNSGEETQAIQDHQDKGNAFGLVDMLGTLWEWCEDHWFNNYQDASSIATARTEKSPNNDFERVCRGGCWLDDETFQYCASRVGYDPAERDIFFGLRVARSLEGL